MGFSGRWGCRGIGCWVGDKVSHLGRPEEAQEGYMHPVGK